MKKYLLGACLMVLMVTAVPTAVRADTTNLSAMLELLQSLMKQVEVLQSQLATLKGDIKDELRAGLKEGMEDEDIKKIQELLATDPTIYPKGIVSGYYGSLTKEAVEKLQARYGLVVTGEVDDETQRLMQELFRERINGKFPPGLLKAPGIEKKIRERMSERNNRWELNCDYKKGAGLLCKDRDEDDDGEDKEENNKGKNRPVASSTAATALDLAEDAIDDLKDAIALASTSTSTDEDAIDDAEGDLADAEEELDEAEEDFEARRYRQAYDRAVKARKIAEKALADLIEDTSDDDDDDDDEDDEDDDDDDDDDDDADDEDDDDDD